MSANVRKWASVILSTFAGGAITYATGAAASGLPDTKQAIESFAVGALIAGASAVIHLLQNPPGTTAGQVAK